MRNRWLQLAFALLVAIAPSAHTLCQIACATHAADHHGQQTHSCHDTPPAGEQIVPVPHACGHESELPDGSTVSTTDSTVLPIGDLPNQGAAISASATIQFRTEFPDPPPTPPDISRNPPLRI